MTQTESTIKFLSTLEKGTELTRQEYNIHRRNFTLVSFDTILADPQKFNVAKIINYRRTISTKFSAVDVLEMVKQGYTPEQIEKKIYTYTKQIAIKKL